ncbi:pilus assembly protein [bacterium]|nr:pilus assembly protein [bacterium]
MKKFIKETKGNVIVFTAIAMTCMIGFAALSIDVSTLLTARNELQCATDAAALSGATGLLESYPESRIRAIATAGRNQCMNQCVDLTASDVTFPQTNQIMVQAQLPVTLNFSPVLGINSANISAIAVAELGTIVGTKGLKPWAVPDMNYEPGDIVCIKAGVLGAPGTEPSFFYPIDFPPMNRGIPESGACVYRENIIHTSSSYVSVGDILQVEPGNMVGPTQQGVNSLIGQDPDAYWDPGFGATGGVVNSSSGQDGSSLSPRVVIIPMYDPTLPPDSGRNNITVTRLGAFFVTGFQGKSLYGTFMTIWHHGTFGGGSSMLKGVRLVQ